MKQLQLTLNLSEKQEIYSTGIQNLNIEINGSINKCFSITELISLRKLHIIVDSPNFQIKFEDLMLTYQSTIFIVSFINPELEIFERFFQNYKELFKVHNFKLKVIINDIKESEENINILFDKILNKLPQHIKLKMKLNSKHYNSCYLTQFQHSMKERLEISEFDSDLQDIKCQKLQVKSLNLQQSQSLARTTFFNISQLLQSRSQNVQTHMPHLQIIEISDNLNVNNDSGKDFTYNYVIKSPKSIKIQIGTKQRYSCIYEFLMTLTDVERIIELNIQIETSYTANENDIYAINKMYGILSRCTSIQILDIPYINHRQVIQQLKNTLNLLQSLKYIKLRMGSADFKQNTHENFKMMYEIITHASAKLHKLRYIDVDVLCWINCSNNKIDTRQFASAIRPLNVRIGFYGQDTLTKELYYGSKFPNPVKI